MSHPNQIYRHLFSPHRCRPPLNRHRESRAGTAPSRPAHPPAPPTPLPAPRPPPLGAAPSPRPPVQRHAARLPRRPLLRRSLLLDRPRLRHRRRPPAGGGGGPLRLARRRRRSRERSRRPGRRACRRRRLLPLHRRRFLLVFFSGRGGGGDGGGNGKRTQVRQRLPRPRQRWSGLVARHLTPRTTASGRRPAESGCPRFQEGRVFWRGSPPGG